MKEFDELLAVADRLLGPQGCPWDLQQNFFTLQPYVIEESHEVLEAIDEGDDQKIFEELGDLIYLIIFYAKVAQKENRFTIQDVLTTVKEKMIRRHPHIFSEGDAKTADEVMERWEEIKKEEKGHQQRKSAADGIPERLPTLVKAQKLLRKIKKTNYPLPSTHSLDETGVGEAFVQLILSAEKGDVDCESALRRVVSSSEQKFRDWEKTIY